MDPAEDAPVVAALEANGLGKLDFILNTHHHADHVGANLVLKEKYGCKIVGEVVHQDLPFSSMQALPGGARPHGIRDLFGTFFPAGPLADQERIPGIDVALKDGDKFAMGAQEMTVYDTPGHTKGHITLHFPGRQRQEAPCRVPLLLALICPCWPAPAGLPLLVCPCLSARCPSSRGACAPLLERFWPDAPFQRPLLCPLLPNSVGASALFPGDTLFLLGCGRMFEGTPQQMWASLSKARAGSSPFGTPLQPHCAPLPPAVA